MQHSTNSSYSCASVNVTGLHLRTNYVVEVVAIGSDNRRSQPVTFNISTAQGRFCIKLLLCGCLWVASCVSNRVFSTVALQVLFAQFFLLRLYLCSCCLFIYLFESNVTTVCFVSFTHDESKSAEYLRFLVIIFLLPYTYLGGDSYCGIPMCFSIVRSRRRG